MKKFAIIFAMIMIFAAAPVETFAASTGEFDPTSGGTLVVEDITKAEVGGIKAKEFTAAPVTQNITVKLNSKTLSPSDYDVDYTDNIKVGKATVTISGKGNYTGLVSKQFIIYGWSESGKNMTYTKPDGTLEKNAFVTRDGNAYYLGTNGKPSVYTFYVGNDRYYANGNGVLSKNRFVEFKSTGEKVFFGSDGKAKKGFFTTAGKKYYAESNGAVKKYTFYVDKKRYYAGTDGALYINKFVTFNKTGETRFFGSDGSMKYYTFYCNGKRYYAGSDGVVVKNKIINFSKQGYKIYFGKDGAAEKVYR